jgi:hypothetical protein
LGEDTVVFIPKPAFRMATIAALSSLVLGACYGGTTDVLEYIGTFEADYISSPFLVRGNVVRLRVYPESDAVAGAGTLVISKPSAFADDPETTETSILDFEGTYDVDTDSFSGQVHITGGATCSKYCEGTDDTDWDYYADWTGQMAEYDQVILGYVDGGAFDFEANKVILRIPPISELLR